MKLRKISIENVRSFYDHQEINFDGNISILIGPNGGGKTNLLDTISIILRQYLLKSWSIRDSHDGRGMISYQWQQNSKIEQSFLDKHFLKNQSEQTIQVSLELTQSDINNINKITNSLDSLYEKAIKKYPNTPYITFNKELINEIKIGEIFDFTIKNQRISVETDNQNHLLQYLIHYDIYQRLLSEFSGDNLFIPMLNMPIMRSSNNITAAVALAEFNDSDLKDSIDAATSRNPASIMTLAVGRLAAKYRQLLENDTGKAKDLFYEDTAIKKLTSFLEQLGYSWRLECTDINRNAYEVILTKQGSSFSINAASSGEREILTYLFAIYALNIRDALILIDEPELHLHPRWQKMLLNLFEELAVDTNNQFVMATHSAVFVSPSSIQYISRVYSSDQKSQVVRLNNNNLPSSKHLFNIINSQNNERIFFADVVILVEGISDRIFFEAFFKHKKLTEGSDKIYEIVSVGGKNLFDAYTKVLEVSKLPYAIIADLDYLQQIGTADIKTLFNSSAKQIKAKVFDDPTSRDAQSLIEHLENAIETKNTDTLNEVLEYIKNRQQRLKPNFTQEEQAIFNNFIEGQRQNNVFILSRGPIEKYLPIGCRGKDVEALITLVSKDSFLEELPKDEAQELDIIVETLKSSSLFAKTSKDHK